MESENKPCFLESLLVSIICTCFILIILFASAGSETMAILIRISVPIITGGGLIYLLCAGGMCAVKSSVIIMTIESVTFDFLNFPFFDFIVLGAVMLSLFVLSYSLFSVFD